MPNSRPTNHQGEKKTKKGPEKRPEIELKRIPIEEIEQINISFEYQGKQYLLLPKKESSTDAQIAAMSALQLALDHHTIAEIIDPGVDNLKKKMEEITKK